MFNSTPGGERVQRLSGDEDEKVGLAKSLRVMPGDTIYMEIKAKYAPNQRGPSEGDPVLALTGAFGLSPLSEGAAGEAFDALEGFVLSNAKQANGDAPVAGINYILFDENYQVDDWGYIGVSEDALQGEELQVPHERLTLQAIISKPGYAYIFLSNDNDRIVDVYFDDLLIEHNKGKVVQGDDYYPFGLAFNSYSSGVKNDFQYNSFEYQGELDLNLYDYQARYYDPVIGRFININPAADLMRRHSPYNYAFDNPIRFVDPDGMVPTTGDQDEEKEKKDQERQNEEDSQKLLEDYYAQFGMTVEQGVGMVKSDATSREDTGAKTNYKSSLSNKNSVPLSKWEMLLNSTAQAYDIVEFYGEMSDVKVPGKVGAAITIIQIGDKYFKQDEAGLWLEVGKAALGRLVGGYVILAAETFVAVGRLKLINRLSI